jgi:hypothetical protein
MSYHHDRRRTRGGWDSSVRRVRVLAGDDRSTRRSRPHREPCSATPAGAEDGRRRRPPAGSEVGVLDPVGKVVTARQADGTELIEAEPGRGRRLRSGIMLSQRIEGRVLNLVDRVVSGERVEDALVECKAEWPSAARAARQIAGHANAARGEPILWIIGVDEDGHQVASASDVELANWWSQVTAVFDQGITPGLTTLVVPVGTAQSVVALYLTTDRAPYVVSRPEQRSSFDREVPWRDGNRTRSAYRDELLRMLVEAVLPPEATVVRLELRALHRTAEQRAGRPEVPEHVELYLWGYLFFGPPSGPVVVLPAHLMTGQLDFAEHQPRPGALEPLPISVKLASGVYRGLA